MKTKILHYVLAVVCIALLSGCGEDFPVKQCAYCDGAINWSQMDHGKIGGTKWSQEFEFKEGKYYHKWCYKFREDIKR